MVLGRGLGRGKGVLIDAGLHNMYVHTIRRAKHFIYIENQFFTGVPQLLLSICVTLRTSSSQVWLKIPAVYLCGCECICHSTHVSVCLFEVNTCP